jgi:hypothetical protein
MQYVAVCAYRQFVCVCVTGVLVRMRSHPDKSTSHTHTQPGKSDHVHMQTVSIFLVLIDYIGSIIQMKLLHYRP